MELTNVETGQEISSEVEFVPTLKNIYDLQNYLLSQDGHMESKDFDHMLKHTFSENSYAREMTIPPGIIIIGRVHRHSHLNIISRGKILVFTTEGKRVLDATKHPVTFSSFPGTKRVVLALEETIWTTIHITDEMDPDKIVELMTIPEEEVETMLKMSQCVDNLTLLKEQL
jgi:hypothetical protein